MKFGQIVWVVVNQDFPRVYQGRIVESEIVCDGESQKIFYTVDCEVFEHNGFHYSETFKVEENFCFTYEADAVNCALSLNDRSKDLVTKSFSLLDLTDKVISYIQDNSEVGSDYKKISLLVAKEIEKRFK